MTFNGYSGQYVTHPLTAKPGDLVRFGVVDAGPSLDTDFHIVGTILNTAYAFGDMHPADALHNVQTVTVPAGGGGVFDVKIDTPGLLPVRVARICRRRPGPGRPPERRQRPRNDEPLTAHKRATDGT